MGELMAATPYDLRTPYFRPLENPYRFEDPQSQAISDRAWNLGATTPADIRDKVGIVYVDLGLGLGEEVAAKFANGDSSVNRLVGIALSGQRTENPAGFWDAIEELFPGQFSATERASFAEFGDQAITDFMATFENVAEEPSRVLNQLITTAIAYK